MTKLEQNEMEMDSKQKEEKEVDLFKVDRVLTSLRESDFTLESAIGEIIDNSLQAKGNIVKILMIEAQRKVNVRSTTVTGKIGFYDDGIGMDDGVLHGCLQMGYSTRYNDRSGIGRFGVGATLAAISQCQRIEIYSRTTDNGPFSWTYIDLEEISNGSMEYIPIPIEKEIPDGFKTIVNPIGSGTLIVWDKCDRIQVDSKGSTITFNSVQSTLSHWIGRTYRTFLDGGIKIFLNEKEIYAHDPLYVMPSKLHPEVAPAMEIEPVVIPVQIPNRDGEISNVTVRMTLIDKSHRAVRGVGGLAEAKKLRITDNEGVSVLRAGREIAYDIIREIQGAAQDIDRWWSCEISFDPLLDELWQVRNIKRGARPVESLAEQIKSRIGKTIKTFRDQIQADWKKTTNEENKVQGVHHVSEDIAKEVEPRSVKGRAGKNTPIDHKEKLVTDLLTTKTASQEQFEERKERFFKQPFTILDSDWPGSEFFEAKYLGDQIIIQYNNRHPFFEKVYRRLLEIEKSEEPVEVNPDLIALVRNAIDLLLVGYSKAESQYEDPEDRFSDLRGQWGIHLKSTINKLSTLINV
ncbi:TPA: ATP-binding protein [Clostridioides difficile]